MFEAWLPLKTPLERLMWLKRRIGGGASWVWRTITGAAPLTLANAVSHSIHSLTQYGLCAQASTPTPSAPVDIMCNNGAIKYGWYDIITTSQLSGYGTYVSPSGTAGNRAYKWLKDLPNGTYQISVDGDYELIVQWRDPADPSNIVPSAYENLSGWITSGEVVLDKEGGGYGIAVRRTSGTSPITPSNFDGTLHVQQRGLYVVGTPEVLTVSGINLCNPDYYQGDGWYVGANNTVTTANANGTLVMPCKPNTTYSWWHTAGTGGCRAFELPTDTVAQGQAASWAVGNPAYVAADVVKKYTTSASAKLLCVLFGRDAEAVGRTIEAQLADFMLVEGDITTATAYEPYSAPQTVTDIPMLLSVGDVKDEAEIISGLLTHKVGIKVFDGTETVNVSSAGNAYIAIDGVAIGAPNTPIDTHFALETSTTSLAEGRARFGANGQTISSSNYYMNHPTARTAADFKAWLASEYANGTPVIVLYPLATETTEQTTAHSLHTTEGENLVDVVSNVDPVDLSVEYASTQVGFGFGNPNEQENEGEGNE